MHDPFGVVIAPVRATALVLVATLIATLLSTFAVPAQRVAAAPATTNAEVNLRAGPGEWFDVLTVIPAGGAVSIDGDAVDGFSPVTYDGVSGWVNVGFLNADGAGAAAPVGDPMVVETAPSVITADPNTEVVYTDTSAQPAQQEGGRNRQNNRQRSSNSGDGTPTAQEDEIIDIIYEAAHAYGQSPEDMIRVARCESNLNPRAVDPSGQNHGLFQFLPSTFHGTPYGHMDIYDPWANAHAAGWMWSEGHKNQWVCQ